MWQTLIPEILCRVFACTIQNQPLLTFEPHLFPWYLGHICRAWRDVFISSPEIWTYFVIDFDKNYSYRTSPECIQLSLDMVQLCLDRSKCRPIRFAFMHYWGLVHQSSLEILRALIIHSARWKHAYFKMDSDNFPALIEVKSNLPILDSLYLIICHNSSLAPSAHFPDLFDNTPQLQHLCFNSYPLWKLDWSSLSTLHLKITEGMHAASYSITHASSKLEELVIDGTLPDNMLPLTLPSLKRLGVPFEVFLESLKTPALEELCIITEAEDEFSPDDPILHRIASRFIREQALPLKKVAIYSDCINAASILLQYAPDTTRHLYLSSSCEDIVSVLSACSAARYLESVTYEHCWGYQYLLPVAECAESWREQSIVAGSKGIGPFENIQQFSIKLIDMFIADEQFADLVDRLKKPFEKCGVKCSVRPAPRMADWNLKGVPPYFHFSFY